MTGVLRELGKRAASAVPSHGLHHRTACLFQQHKESAATSLWSSRRPWSQQQPFRPEWWARKSGRPHNLTLAFVMLLALPEKEKPSDLFLYLCLAPCRPSPWAVGSCCPPLGIV